MARARSSHSAVLTEYPYSRPAAIVPSQRARTRRLPLALATERDCEGVDLERGLRRQQRVPDAVVKAMAGRADAEVAQRGQDRTSTTAGA